MLLQLIGIIIFVVFILTIDVNSLVSAVTHLDLFIICTVVLFILVNLVIKGARWQYLVKRYSGIHISIGKATSSIVAGVAAGSLLPGRVEPAKPMLLKRVYGIPLNEGMSAMMVERIFDLLALIFLFAVSAALLFSQLTSSAITYISLVLLIAVLTAFMLAFLIFPMAYCRLALALVKRLPLKPVRKANLEIVVQGFFGSVKKVHSSRAITAIFLLSVAATLMEVVRLYFIFQSLGSETWFVLLTFALCAGVLAGIAALIPGGIGINEITESEIIDSFSNSASQSGNSSIAVLIDRLFAYYFLVLIGSIVLLFSRKIYAPISLPPNSEEKNRRVDSK